MIVKFTGLLPFSMPEQTRRTLGAIGALGLISLELFAQDVLADIPAKKRHSAYLQDSRGLIVRSSQGLCWRSGDWGPEDAVAGCDGPLVPPISKIIAPPWLDQPAPTVTRETVPASIPTRPASCAFSFTLNGDTSFTFDGAKLSTAARRQIDTEVLPRLTSCPHTTALQITGHTDRMGSPQYNRSLSLHLARSVAEYLREQGVGLPIEAAGAGASQAQQQCLTPQNRSALLACLAPDRKVTIEVRGTQD